MIFPERAKNALLIVAFGYIALIFMVKWLRVDAAQAELSQRGSELSQRLDVARQKAVFRQTFLRKLRDTGYVFPPASADEALRNFRAALSEGLPGLRPDIRPGGQTAIDRLSKLELVPVTLRLRVPDDALLSAVQTLDAMRPGIAMTGFAAVPMEGPKTQQGQLALEIELTVSGFLLADAGSGGKP